ncbi:MAG: DinB family protein [Anaerolineae bacterium]|jgi:hypothetical protein
MMPRVLCDSLLDNYQKAIGLVAETIGQFDQDQWQKGISFFQVPAKIAYHIVDCLDYYFREDPAQAYKWGYRFGGGWWELPDEGQPSQEALLAYLQDVEARIVQHLSSLDDANLVTPYDAQQEHGETRLGHYIYGLRHTMHHHGALSLFSLQYGNEEGSWA